MEQDNQLSKPKVSASAQRHLDKAEAQFDKYHEELKSLSQNDIKSAPVREEEMQTKLSQREIQKNNDLWLKPERTIPDRQTFNEKFRKDWEFAKEYVNFIAEHKEIVGEKIEIWTHPFGGVGASFWRVPVNKPIWGPRYLAEQIKSRTYVRYKTEDRVTQPGQDFTMYGTMVAESQIQRLDAYPVKQAKTHFMNSAENF